MARRDIRTDQVWAQISSLLPSNGQRGGQWKNHRPILEGILGKLRTGAPWRDMPRRYGAWQTCYDRFARWGHDGTWDHLLAQVQAQSEAVGGSVWTVCIDSTTVRAHQHVAGARHRQRQEDRVRAIDQPDHEALGRSRGGLTTKIHLSCDGLGRPLSVALTAGQHTTRASVAGDPCLPSPWPWAWASKDSRNTRK